MHAFRCRLPLTPTTSLTPSPSQGLETFQRKVQHKGWIGGWMMPQVGRCRCCCSRGVDCTTRSLSTTTLATPLGAHPPAAPVHPHRPCVHSGRTPGCTHAAAPMHLHSHAAPMHLHPHAAPLGAPMLLHPCTCTSHAKLLGACNAPLGAPMHHPCRTPGCMQEASYWALALPRGWWLLGVDLALVEDIDMCQYRLVPSHVLSCTVCTAMY